MTKPDYTLRDGEATKADAASTHTCIRKLVEHGIYYIVHYKLAKLKGGRGSLFPLFYSFPLSHVQTW